MWILDHCIWEDIGIWDDTDFWCDSPSLPGISGTLNVIEGPDSAVFTLSVAISGTLSVLEAPDSAVFIASIPIDEIIIGEMFVVEEPDSANLVIYTSNPPTVETHAETFKYGRKVILPNRW